MLIAQDDDDDDDKQDLGLDKYEMINHKLNEYSKQVQNKYKSRHDWVGKGIYRELCKRLLMIILTSRYMYKPEFVIENETHEILWDFEIQTDHPIPARRLDLVLINMKEIIFHPVDFAVPVDHKVKLKENVKTNDYLDIATELKKKTVERKNFTVISSP